MSTHKRSLWQYFLDIFFPQDADIIELEKISVAKLRETRNLLDHNLPEWIHANLAYQYEDVRKMIWHMKYKGNTVFPEIFSEILYEEMLAYLGELQEMQNIQKAYVIPIPMTFKKKRKRQYNQTEILAKKICAKSNCFIYTPQVLKKIKETKSQTKTKNKRQRLENIKNSFRVIRPKEILDKTIFIVDDVTTTGATLREARKVLKEAGAKKVEAFVIAH